MESKPSICPLCSRGCSISIDYHPGFARFEVSRRVYRIKARENPKVNGHWICDKGRYEYNYIDQDRLTEVLADGQSISVPEALTRLEEMIKQLVHKNKTKRISVLLNSFLSNEELYLIRRIFRDQLNAGHIRLIDPADEQGDDLLLTSERSPNRRGAEEIGFENTPSEDIDFSDTDLLIVFESFFPVPKLEQILNRIPDNVTQRVLFTPRQSSAAEKMSLVFPTAVIAEKMGSLTNSDGCVQPFLPALEPLNEAEPEWRWLMLLGKSLGTDFPFYSRIQSPINIYTDIKKDISFFQDAT
jgi:NADH-quinone oxidoreductase subunit G